MITSLSFQFEIYIFVIFLHLFNYLYFSAVLCYMRSLRNYFANIHMCFVEIQVQI